MGRMGSGERGRIFKYVKFVSLNHEKIGASENIQAFIEFYFETFIENFIIANSTLLCLSFQQWYSNVRLQIYYRSCRNILVSSNFGVRS